MPAVDPAAGLFLPLKELSHARASSFDGGFCYHSLVPRPPTRFRIVRLLTIADVQIEDTFAEAFPMTAARLVVTAEAPRWAETAGQVATGYAASVIGCDAEAGIERLLGAEE